MHCAHSAPWKDWVVSENRIPGAASSLLPEHSGLLSASLRGAQTHPVPPTLEWGCVFTQVLGSSGCTGLGRLDVCSSTSLWSRILPQPNILLGAGLPCTQGLIPHSAWGLGGCQWGTAAAAPSAAFSKVSWAPCRCAFPTAFPNCHFEISNTFLKIC